MVERVLSSSMVSGMVGMLGDLVKGEMDRRLLDRLIYLKKSDKPL